LWIVLYFRSLPEKVKIRDFDRFPEETFKIYPMKSLRKTVIGSCLLITFLLLVPIRMFGQDKPAGDAVPEFQMTVVKQIPALAVQSQASTSTCWCFGTTSMLESELIRLGHGEIGLSEMFTVRNTYAAKAEQYVRFHGTCNFGDGGEPHDVLSSIARNGIVPRDIYPGLNYGETSHKHGEVSSALTGIVENVVKNRNGRVSPVWMTGFNGVLDAYFGELPVSFSWNGKMYTPGEFAQELGIKAEDYVEFTSFTHHPFYSKCVLEIPDNWAQGAMWNVPVDELMEIVDYALGQGVSLAWAADISDLRFREGFGRIMADGADVNDPRAEEKAITQADRQYMFDSYQLTDDHDMHLVGYATDQFGNKYYLEKNSWGDGGKFKGYSYMSLPFMKMRTIAIMVHKDGIPPAIAEKIGLK